jgi:ABC-type cobalamin/Fe3+-siderophores transport system ATPase subunit
VIVARDVRIDIAGRTLLAGIDAEIRAGEFVAVLGANGVGKTTFLRALDGRHPIAGGTLTLDARAVASFDATTRARAIALVAGDDSPVDELSVRQVVTIGRYPFHRWWQWNATSADDDAVDAALLAVNMHAFAERSFATLSSGERQRVWLALGLAQEAPLLLLDEPTSHLDVRAAHDILRLLRQQARAGKIVVCAIHDLNEAAGFADRLMLLGDGRVVAFDIPERVLTAAHLQLAYGIDLHPLRTPDGGIRVFARAD